MKDIGSIFSLDALPVVRTGVQLHAGRQYYALCREALLQIAMDKERSNKVVMVPAFTCSTVVYPFEQAGWRVVYYAVTRSFRIGVEHFAETFERENPAIIVAHPYFGTELNEDETHVLQKAKDHGATIVVDITQCYFSEQRIACADYYVGSLYKWFPIVDGGFMESRITHAEPSSEYDAFVLRQTEAMYLRARALSTNDEYMKAISRRINKEAVAIYNGEVNLHKMSDLSKSLLIDSNEDDARCKRWNNTQFLLRSLEQKGSYLILTRDDIVTPPLYVPVACENRNDVQRKLAENHIYAPALWSLYDERMLISEDVQYLYSHLLAIPVDQRYYEQDMQRILDVLE